MTILNFHKLRSTFSNKVSYVCTMKNEYITELLY